MDKRKVLSKLLPMIVLVSLSIAAGVTGAAVIHSMQLENPIKTPVVEGGITENLDQGAKEVSFTNNGEADVFLRVAFGSLVGCGILHLQAVFVNTSRNHVRKTHKPVPFLLPGP